MARIVRIEVEEPFTPRNLVDLNDDINSFSFMPTPSSSSSPPIFHAVEWPVAILEFPPQKLWPFVRTFTILGYSVPRFTPTLHKDIAAQIREAFAGMKRLTTVIIDDVIGGLWPELLDAFSVLSTPCDLELGSHWDPAREDEEYLVLQPRRTSLPLASFRFIFPLVYASAHAGGGVGRRLSLGLKHEMYNIRTILAAAAETLSYVYLPGEIFPTMYGFTWSALTELYLDGLWPVERIADRVVEASSTPPRQSSPQLMLGQSPEPVETHTSKDGSESATLAEVAPPVSTLVSPTIVDEIIPKDEASVLASRDNNVAETEVFSESLPDDLTSASDKGNELSVATASNPTVDEDIPTPLLPTTPQPLESSLVRDDSFTLSPLSSSDLLSILEAMPNLRLLKMRLFHQKMDPQPVGGVICASDIAPKSPATFLRHLTQFDVTSLSQNDRTFEFLPASLELLSLPRYPYTLSLGTSRAIHTPATVLSLLKRAVFPCLTTLKIWYHIESLSHIEDEKGLLDLLPDAFPMLQTLEVCRRWQSRVTELQGRWDPAPVAKRLISRLKDLQIFYFDSTPPERHGEGPYTFIDEEIRGYLGRLRDMAEDIASAAPWLRQIAMYTERGTNPDLYWKFWNVLRDQYRTHTNLESTVSMRAVVRETEQDPISQIGFDKLNHDVLLMIFEQMSYDECLQLATLSRRLRAVLLPVIYRRLRWAPGIVGFPPQRILPFTQVFTLTGHNVRRFTPTQHATIASQFREAFVTMKALRTFILAGNVPDGLWSELLDAFAVLSNPIDLVVHAHWQPDDEEEEPIKLEPRTTTLPLRRFSFTVPFMYDVSDREIGRRLSDTIEFETENIRVILAASVPTMALVEIPGELISALDGPIWTSLTELYLTGLWPTFDAVGGNSPDVGPVDASLEHTLSTPSDVVALISPVKPSDTAQDPLDLKEGSLPPLVKSKAENEPNPAEVTEDTTSISSEALPPLKIVESSSTPSPTTTTNPLENASNQQPFPSSTKASPILKPMAQNLSHQSANLKATCLPNDDRIIDFLPSTLEVLSLRRYPFWLEDGMRRVLPTPLTIHSLLKRAEFSALTTLRFWYLIRTKEELEYEKTLLDLLPQLFPLVQDLEFCRRWNHRAALLEGCQWDPMPIVCDFFPRFKHLQSILFDPDLPERDGWPPQSYPSSEFREMVGRLHGMAGEIVNAAPWVKRIGMYRAYGNDERLYWEIWGVVPAPEGKVALDRPPPPIINSIFYP
ncbi:hypothetical protein MIND_00780300 [Mycena indigotica]|uniref:F-box domain-containing protein n=1 Tax=Mycena indigotica TaxID=2126181 RepID=A0A8H6SLU6_9AGAR|nr:uncharacterized protein MIND_00780300 [Mycena indigotica]KAF7302135.1 hypothetical protein MIND_00780300 [Mycena indigotica]